MEKHGVIKEGLTPELKDEKAEDCVKTAIVDNNTDKTIELDADFRKKAAIAAASKLAN